MMVDLNTRKHARVALEMPVKYEVRKNQTDHGPTQSGVIADISEGGMAIRAESFLARGTRLRIELDQFPPSDNPDHKLKKPFELEGHVKRCMMVSGQPRYVIAVSLDDPRGDFVQSVRDYEKQLSVAESSAVFPPV